MQGDIQNIVLSAMESRLVGIEDVAGLEEALSEPTEAVIEAVKTIKGDVVLLGVGGKMGITLARMIRRAGDTIGATWKVIGVSRFGDGDPNNATRVGLGEHGIETVAADLLEPGVMETLPDADVMIYMTGMKFGSTGNEAGLWAVNAHAPALAAQRYRESRIVAFSTGNVYGLSPVAGGGSIESDAVYPVGEYATSCLGRERMFEYASQKWGTHVSLIRLNYAVEFRYGVFVDMTQRILAKEPIDLSMGCFNAIWQRDANAMTVASLMHASNPAFVLNVTGPELLSVRRVCDRIGKRLGVEVVYTGEEASTALLSNAQLSHGLYGYPTMPIEPVIDRVVDWVANRGEVLGKPTKFESRTGKF